MSTRRSPKPPQLEGQVDAEQTWTSSSSSSSSDEEARVEHPTTTSASRADLKRPSSRTSKTSSSSTARQPALSSPARRNVPSPRRQPARRTVLPPSSPPPRTPRASLKSVPAPPPPTFASSLTSTLTLSFSLLASAPGVLSSLLHALLLPFLPYILAPLLLSCLAYLLLPHIPNLLLRLLGSLLRLPLASFHLLPSSYPSSSDISAVIGQEALLLPLRLLATPSCLLLGTACQLSLQSKNGTVAEPFWRWQGGASKGNELDVGKVARELTKDVRGARDVFESVRALGDGSLGGGLEYVRIWELGVAVQVGSNLDDKEFLGRQLVELGDATRDVSDEIMHIDSVAVNAFSWLQWEFDRIVQLLSLPPHRRPTEAKLAASLHSLLSRLSNTLQTLQTLTAKSAYSASSASEIGRSLLFSLQSIRAELEREKERSPVWKRALDRSSHLIVGGEPSRTELISRDLRITRQTVDGLGPLRQRLEATRQMILGFKSQIGEFEAGMMGFHIGATAEGGLGAEEEVMMLREVVEGLGRAVGAAKLGYRAADDGEDSGEERLGIEG